MRSRRRILGWSLLGGVAFYALAWTGVSLTMLGMSGSARAEESARAGLREAPGIGKFAVVDDHLWRGAAPTTDGYRWLAAQGVRTVIDLRAEHLPAEVLARPGRAGLTAVRLPLRDGQAPSPQQVGRFLSEVGRARGPVFVHCGAGVGRTGAMAAAYLVRTGQADAGTAARRSLALGPPTLEQLSFMRGLGDRRAGRPPAAVVALSRVADSPRRSWARLTN
ncbi:fused DSP-PTPase phosphatase/NAD kinase-like protein [Actinomadura macra]|uniref:fused DSP-PTPase phosphatase/NAD kinase-like protein n=1 Tax=Actinomadura macra TaxID=46164 RepID=UPI00082B6FC3|nr:dual specificity protein phosphatase family protein [Actinomadura macra]